MSDANEKLGDAEALFGNFTAARAYYNNSLNIRRGLAVQFGNIEKTNTTQSVIYQSKVVSPNADGRRAIKAAYERCQGIRLGYKLHVGAPTIERDLSVSLNKVGDAASVAGENDAARAAYQEGLDILRRLSARLATPAAERDLSVSLNKVGDAASVAGENDAARAAYQESLDIRRRLSARLGTPEAERDLSISLHRVTRAAIDGGDGDSARTYHQEGVAQIARLHEIHKAEMQSAFDGLAAKIEALE